MNNSNLILHISTGEADNSFVGMKIQGNQIHFYYPEGYHLDNNNIKREDLLDLLKTISIAKSMSMDGENTFDSHKNGSNLALLSYIWILEDYLRNGFCIDFEKEYKPNHRGKINWKKTLQQQPIISDGNIIFSKIIAETNNAQDSVLAEVHRFCVKRSATLLGWLYGISPETIEVIPVIKNMIPKYLAIINYKLHKTFDDEKQLRLVHMKNVLIGLDEIKNENTIMYGVDSYHYIFERMIDYIFGTEAVDGYYPKFKWYLRLSKKPEGLTGPTIRPDTIMSYGANNDIYIIDSKYYRYGSLDLSQTKGLPEASSIVKQITYGSYVQSIHPEKRVYSVFILPYDAKSSNAELLKSENRNLVYIGSVSSNWASDKTYGTIHTFLIDLKYVVKTWNRLHHDQDKQSLATQIQNTV